LVNAVRQFARLVFTAVVVLGAGCGGGNVRTAPTTTSSSAPAVVTSTTSTTLARSATTVAVTRTTTGSPSTTARGGAIALCKDGTLSYAADHQAECASHGGVAQLTVQ
jgi:hypothetical protein